MVLNGAVPTRGRAIFLPAGTIYGGKLKTGPCSIVIGIFKALKGLPATIRLLDPPLHEFVPDEEKAQADLARKMGVSKDKVKSRVAQLHVFNPMLGHRGCRLGIAYPEITVMQARAIFEAAADVAKKKIKVKPEVMIPLVGFKEEFDLQAGIVHATAAKVMAEKKIKFDYQVGTMIEVPRGALTADEIAHGAEFFSFGTNDLTQTALGICGKKEIEMCRCLRFAPAAATTWAVSSCPTRRPKCSRRIPSPPSMPPASASSWKSPSPKAAKPALTSNSAFASGVEDKWLAIFLQSVAANTAATRTA